MSEPESEWLTVSFNIKILGTTVAPVAGEDRVNLLRGLAQAATYLLLPDSDYTGIKVLASGLKVRETSLFTDEMLDEWLAEGDDPRP